MPALTITSANLALTSSSQLLEIEPHLFGEAGTAGAAYYRKASDNKLWLGDNGTAEEAVVIGILVTPTVAANGSGLLVIAGQLIIGGTMVEGVTYALATGGQIIPIDELVSTELTTIIGTASSTTVLDLAIQVTGIEQP